MLVAGGVIAEIGKWMAIIGVVIILIWAGREKGRNPFKRLVGANPVWGHQLDLGHSVLHALVRYRPGTSVIGMVINQLVGMAFSSGIIGAVIGSVLFVGAHAFNLGINA